MKSTPFGNTIVKIAILVLLLPAAKLVAQNPDSAALSKLMEQVKSHAALAQDDAATLERFTRSRLHWQTHATQINQMKEHVNNLLADASKLKTMRDEGSPWQQEAIDRISPLLPVIAAHLTAMIEHFNERPSQIRFQTYRDFVVANQALIENAHTLIADYVKYGKAKSRAESLERKLQVPATAALNE